MALTPVAFNYYDAAPHDRNRCITEHQDCTTANILLLLLQLRWAARPSPRIPQSTATPKHRY